MRDGIWWLKCEMGNVRGSVLLFFSFFFELGRVGSEEFGAFLSRFERGRSFVCEVRIELKTGFGWWRWYYKLGTWF